MFKNRSKLLLVSVILNSLFSIWILFYFNYLDRLNYSESLINDTAGLALLIQNMFTSTWWALVILTFVFITIFSLVSFIYKDIKFQFISICLWFVLLIISFNFKESFLNNLSAFSILLPFIILNIVSYFNQKKII